MITRKTSVQYKQSIYSRKNSGGPGYIKGKKILVGNITQSSNGKYINQSSDGFVIRGADNQGNCYNIKTSLTTGLNTTSFLIEDPNENLYFDDPVLLFEDSVLYGCKV